MRNWNQYLELWQQKRNELHIGSDANTDWSDMHQLLDKHMPVNIPGNDGNLSTGNALTHLAKFKLLYVAAGFIVAAGIITYVAGNKNNNNKNNRYQKHKTEVRKDNISANPIAVEDSLENDKNSAPVTNLPADATGKDHPENNNKINGSLNVLTSDNSKITTSANAPATNYNSSLKNTREGYKSTVKAHDNNTLSSVNLLTANYNSRLRNNKSVNTSKANHTITGSMLSSRNSNGSGQRAYNRLGNRLPGNHTNQYKLVAGQHNIISGNNQKNEPDAPRLIPDYKRQNNSTFFLTPALAKATLTWNEVASNAKLTSNLFVSPNTSIRILDKSARNVKSANSSMISNFDWGLLLGFNTNGSFTSKAQNFNFYGSFPVDIYLGVFVNHNFNDQWAVGAQGRFLTPHTDHGSYNYNHPIKVDTLQTVQTFKINNSRKIYTIDVPIHLIYKATPNIRLKAGPLLSIPIKDVNRISVTELSYKDSTRYVDSVKSKLKPAYFENKLRYGLSVGAGFTYKFLWLDATYSYYPQSQKAGSALGSFTTNTNNLQITLGIKLNKLKK
ncbi:outer membrane beta-barrel protein [Mucilaginibacter panaciglaebae]|uniref:Outer membrane protein beta-barrel domain-containing protein n=1 Tax=Mucilaginibacter panaciglaebae TaxID=502331 RepID=A0ABP7WN52_9SPHI